MGVLQKSHRNALGGGGGWGKPTSYHDLIGVCYRGCLTALFYGQSSDLRGW